MKISEAKRLLEIEVSRLLSIPDLKLKRDKDKSYIKQVQLGIDPIEVAIDVIKYWKMNHARAE